MYLGIEENNINHLPVLSISTNQSATNLGNGTSCSNGQCSEANHNGEEASAYLDEIWSHGTFILLFCCHLSEESFATDSWTNHLANTAPKQSGGLFSFSMLITSFVRLWMAGSISLFCLPRCRWAFYTVKAAKMLYLSWHVCFLWAIQSSITVIRGQQFEVLNHQQKP